MAKPELIDLISWLNKNERNRFEIYDVDRQKSLEKCASYIDLSKDFEDPEGYFKSLANDGVRTVQIMQKRKNGSSYVREDCAWNYGLSTDGSAIPNVAASGQSVRPAATPQQYGNPSSGLGNPSMGLGFPEIMAMKSQADRFEDLKLVVSQKEMDNKALLSKIETLEKENKTLEHANLTNELGKESKPSPLEKLLESLAANPASIPEIIKSFKGSATPALNGPSGPQLSPTKARVVETMGNSDLLDDHVERAFLALIQYASGNSDFVKEYEQLLIKHNLITNASNNSTNNGNY